MGKKPRGIKNAHGEMALYWRNKFNNLSSAYRNFVIEKKLSRSVQKQQCIVLVISTTLYIRHPLNNIIPRIYLVVRRGGGAPELDASYVPG